MASKIDDGKGAEALTSDIDLHSSIATQVGIIGEEERDIFADNSIDSSNTIVFKIQSSLDLLLKPCHLSLYGTYKVVTADGKDIPKTIPDPQDPNRTIANPAMNVIPINFTNGSIFKSIQVKINDQVVEGGSTLQPWRSDLSERLFHNEQVKNRQHFIRGWMEEGKAWENLTKTEKDTIFKATTDHLQMEGIKGFVARWIRSKNSQEFSAISPLFLDITQQERCLPPNTTLTFSFTKHDLNNFNVLTDNKDTNYKIKITNMYLKATLKKIDTDILENMQSMAQKGEHYRIPINRVEMSQFIKTAGGTNLSENNLVKSGNISPNRIFVTFIDQDAFSGSKEKDPFNYRNIDISNVSLVADGNKVVGREINCNRNEFDFHEPVHYLYKAVNLFPQDEESLGIDLTNYDKRNFILGFKMGYTEATPLELNDIPDRTFYRLNVRLHSPLTRPLAMLVYAEYPSEIIIDAHGNVKRSDDALALE